MVLGGSLGTFKALFLFKLSSTFAFDRPDLTNSVISIPDVETAVVIHLTRFGAFLFLFVFILPSPFNVFIFYLYLFIIIIIFLFVFIIIFFLFFSFLFSPFLETFSMILSVNINTCIDFASDVLTLSHAPH